MSPRAALLAVVFIARVADLATADEPSLGDRLPRIAPVAPAQAEGTFVVQPGYRMELVAAEPLVSSPVAVDFDAAGRMYVVEMRDYSEQDREKLGRVRRLEDVDGDGRYDRATTFAEGLSWPTALLVYRDGLFVGAAPDIWLLRDADGDGLADDRQVVITGLSRTNVQGMLNSFRWGLDGRVHAAASSGGGDLRVVARGAAPSTPLAIRGRDFSFDPGSFALRPESGGAQHGMCFDDWGRKFVCSNSNHAQLVLYEDRYLARNPLLAAPSPLVSIAVDGPAAEVFRASPVEPWRVVRTELRVAGKVPGPIEGGGRAAGYFTSATGITIYRGDAWPEADRGLLVVGDVGSNLVHRKRLAADGLSLRGERIDRQSELVASRDIWFRPVQFAHAPDGSLYVVDMYREVIEHPASLPPQIKRHLDLTSGRDRGRIYRLVPEGFRQPDRPRLDQADAAALVAALSHPNAWQRETAARLLIERREPTALAPLAALAGSSPAPLARMHALCVLGALGALEEPTLAAALADAEPRVRSHAARLSEPLLARSAALAAQLAQLADDPDPLVRYQAAFSLGESPAEAATAALARIYRRDGHDPWPRLAVLSSTAGRSGALAARLVEDRELSPQLAVLLLPPLAVQLGREARGEEIAALVARLGALPDERAAVGRVALRAIVLGLGAGRRELLQKLRAEHPAVADALVSLRRQAVAAALDQQRPAAERAEAIALLGLLPDADSTSLLAPLFQPQEPREVQIAVLKTLDRLRDERLLERIAQRWPALSPTVRLEALETLFARADRVAPLLAALERRAIPLADVDPARLKRLAQHADADVRRRAGLLLATLALGKRDAVVNAYRDALQLAGDVQRGRSLFRQHCSACHRLENVGQTVGADLSAIRNRGAETILLAVLDPNREVNPQFASYVLQTSEGRTLTGMIAAETATSVTLRRAEGAEDTVLRGDIELLQSTGLSLMPEGLERQFSKQDLADLVAYLMRDS